MRKLGCRIVTGDTKNEAAGLGFNYWLWLTYARDIATLDSLSSSSPEIFYTKMPKFLFYI